MHLGPGWTRLASLHEYAQAKRNEFLILDALPKQWRALVHEYGSNTTLRLYRMGLAPEAARVQLQHELRAAAG